MKSNFELLKENEQLRGIYTDLLNDIKKYQHLCFAERKLRNGVSYTNGIIENSKRSIGRINIIDLPEHLGLKEIVIKTIAQELQRLQDEFDSYSINK